MRRRLDRHELADATIYPHHALSDFDGVLTLDDPPPLALYDEALWAELVEARAKLRDAEARVAESAREEQLDAVEVECGRKMWHMLHFGAFDRESWDRLEDQLLAHAATVERK